jgi:glycosyltransferase involved in cell wall biosynthesis
MKNKTILHIPSWYPTQQKPHSGIFIRNFIFELANNNLFGVGVSHIVLNWHDSPVVSIRNPVKAILSLIKHIIKKPVFKYEGRVLVVHVPFIVLSERLFGSNEIRLQRVLGLVVKKHALFKTVNLIHAHVTYPAGFLGHKIALSINAPLVISEHSGDFPHPGYLNDIYNKLLIPLKGAKVVTSVSPHLSSRIELLTQRPVSTIANLTGFEKMCLDPSPSGKFNFLVVTRLQYQKGVDILMLACRLLADENLNFKVLIVTSEYSCNGWQNMLDAMHLNEHVTIKTGLAYDEIIRHYRVSDCLISPSREESFGMTIIEAFSHGIPVIATRCGGPEYIVNESNGKLVAPGNYKDLSNEMKWMIRCGKQSYNGELIYKSANELYSADIIVKQYNEVYNQAIIHPQNSFS